MQRLTRIAVSRRSGFTLVELVISIAVVSVLVVVAAPSLRQMILVQRLRNISQQLATDFQFARNEAVSRGAFLRVAFKFNAAQACYTLYTSAAGVGARCDCTLGAGSACNVTDAGGNPIPAGKLTEVRTVSVPIDTGVSLTTPPLQVQNVSFDPTNGSLMTNPKDVSPTPLDSFGVIASLDATHSLMTVLSRAGRPLICAPAGSVVTNAQACP